MINSKEWNWSKDKREIWTIPCEESYYLADKWKSKGVRRILDLGCGLGRHTIFFAKQGFRVTSVDLSEVAVKYMKQWAKQENVDIRGKIGDMTALPFADNAFDAVFAYHSISHTDTEGILKVIKEIERVLKPNGEIFVTIGSKDTYEFNEEGIPKVDDNTILRNNGEEERNNPYFYADYKELTALFSNFTIERIRHIDDCYFCGKEQNKLTFQVMAKLNKVAQPLDYSDIIGKKVSVIIDRPLGTFHPKHKDIFYKINYGYVEGIIGGDGDEQDIYLLGVDKPVERYDAVVIAVAHRLNDIEDKWIVAPENMSFALSDIQEMISFQERFFEVEIYI